MFEAEFVSKDSDQTETAPNGEQAPMVKEKRELRASDYVELAAMQRVTARYSGAADDLRLADEWEALITLSSQLCRGSRRVTAARRMILDWPMSGRRKRAQNNCRPLEPKLERAAS